jgi:hypothetical protein
MLALLTYRNQIRGKWLVVFFVLLACVDPIDFEVPPAQYQLVVEGQITDRPGPYMVKLSKARSVGDEVLTPEPLLNARVTLFNDLGNSEEFSDKGNGSYLTGGVIHGQIGRSYHIEIETADGSMYTSEPDRLTEGGEVSAIRYEYEARIRKEPFGDFNDDIFNIYIDAEAGSPDETFVRWRFTGTYKVVTNPELHETFLQGEFSYKTPLPCSGYVVVPFIPGGKLEQREPCTCCTCWANHYEDAPQLSDTQLTQSGSFRNIKVGEVPINSATFYDKYLVHVDQISLSRTAFDFFRLIRSQKEGVLSLFQPPSAEIKGNIKNVNNGSPVVGLFYASSVTTKTLFISPDAVPYILPPINLSTDECYVYYKNATTIKPEGWD